MLTCNVDFLIPSYLPAEPHSDQESELAVPLQWHRDLRQLPWQLQLCQLLGVNHASADALPVARLLVHDSQPQVGIVCADPVHLRADRDTATLLPAPMLALRDQEAEQLLTSLNAFVAEDGWQFSRDTAGSWFMQGLDGSALASFPSSFLAHRNASTYLPDGEGSEQWRRLMAELQMLLHTHPVNLAREQRGQLPVNSLWFWGGGDLPSKLQPESEVEPTGSPETEIDTPTLFADDPFVIALAAYLDLHQLPLDAFDPTSAAKAIVVDTRLVEAAFSGDEPGMKFARQSIDNKWLIPASMRITSSKSGKIVLMNEDGDCAVFDESSIASAVGVGSFLNSALNIVTVPQRLWRRLTGSTKD